MVGPRILTAEFMRHPDAGRRLAEAVVAMTATGASKLDGFLIMIRSASSTRAAEIGREQIEANHQRAVASELGGDHAAERAALILSMISGLQIMRQAIGLDALNRPDPKLLADLLGPLFQRLIREP